MSKYESRKQEIRQKLNSDESELFDMYILHYEADYDNKSIRFREFSDFCEHKGIDTTAKLLDAGIRKIAFAAFDDVFAEKFCSMFSNEMKFMYNHNMYRRSFRSKDIQNYMSRLLKFVDLIFIDFTDFDLCRYIKAGYSTDELKERHYCHVSDYFRELDSAFIESLIAVELDENNKALIEVLEDIILGENNVGTVDYKIIRGILKSENEKMHKLLCDLLRAAKLQEGLRQAIFESADFGSLSGFLRILELIIKEDFIRFSSCIRAVDTWMGLGYDYSDKRIIKKLTELAYDYLTDEAKRKEAIQSKDSLELYVALWAESFICVENIIPYIEKMMSGDKYKKLAACWFLMNTQANRLNYEITSKYLDEKDPEVFSMLYHCYRKYFYEINSHYRRNVKNIEDMKNSIWNDPIIRDREYNILFSKMSLLPKEQKIISGKPFEFSSIHMATSSDLFNCLIWLSSYDKSGEKIKPLIENLSCSSSDDRSNMIRYFLQPERSKIEREFLFDSLSDKSMPVRNHALEKIKTITLDDRECLFVEDLLRLKSGDTRKACIEILKGLPKEKLIESVDRLICEKTENKRLAALDIIDWLNKQNKLGADRIEKFISQMPKVSDNEQILINKLTSGDAPVYNRKNGFGLYNPDYFPEIPEIKPTSKYGIEIFKEADFDEIVKIAKAIEEFVYKNKDYTFDRINWDKSVTTVIFGECNSLVMEKKDKFVFEDELSELFKTFNFQNLFFLFYASKLNYKYYLNMGKYVEWAENIFNKYFNYELIKKIKDYTDSEVSYKELVYDIVLKITSKVFPEHLPNIAIDSLNTLLDEIDEGRWTTTANEKTGVGYFREINFSNSTFISAFKDMVMGKTDDEFKNYFALYYKILKRLDVKLYGFGEFSCCEAIRMGLIEMDELYSMLMPEEKERNRLLSRYTRPRSYDMEKALLEKYPFFKEALEKTVARIMEIELKRGDSVTEVTHLAGNIGSHFGIDNFVNILLALGKENFARGYMYNCETKKDVLSNLLRYSKPLKEDNAEKFALAVDGRIPEKRLIEAAMYCPAWLGIIEKYLGFKDLSMAAWYFIAHTGEARGVDFESEIVKYSPVTKSEFQDGAFDIEWFKKAYKSLGKEKFQTLYDCAKYISDNNSHRRAQIFADATMGKLKAAELKKSITEKRNKDSLLAYSLLPLKKDPNKEAFVRYEFIQNFLKESKKFGAQRKTSEAKVCSVAFSNLARNLGFEDIIRFTWKMENLKIKEIAKYFQPTKIGEVELYIDIDENGSSSIKCLKDGKELKSVPAKLKKDAYVEELKKIKTSLTDQYKRAKRSLEQAMENEDYFLAEEVFDLLNHPVIRPLITKLVLRHEDELGFITDEGLKTIDGKIIKLENDNKLLIAHSYDMYILKKWTMFQKYLFENKIVQPFKQVFRELYTVNEDEKHEKILSRRYAGHQVQPTKTLALLKTRNWTANYEEGLQKIYYKQNIIVTIYAMADWYSPADIEAPTLETVRFYDRNNYKPLELENIPPKIFSESMRDLDLVVSVAHVGGVDPEASHSTIEMRAVIMKEIVNLLKLDNVEIREKHAIIKGHFGEYSVHLGSGIVSKQGKGALAILAIQSQHRGRLFLPFIDEDPRTAEIASKVLMLSEDDKIKDPTILNQIKDN